MQGLEKQKKELFLMTNCNKFPIKFSSIKNKKVLANFKGGEVTSDAGLLLLKEIDKKLNLTKNIANLFSDKRQKSKTQHSIQDMLRQRVFGLALGYEDLNDHDTLKNDSAFQVAVGKETALASSPTLCRFENSFNRKLAVEIHKEIIQVFVKSFKTAPKELILDFDATDNPVHGKQEKKAYHPYYGYDCFLPLHVFCGDQLLISYLRPSNQDGAKHAWAISSLLVKYFRRIWPEVKIIFRGDCGFCRHKMLQWFDKNQVDYVVGIGGNSRIKAMLEPTLQEVKERYSETKEKQKIFKKFVYSAHSWKRERTVIGKAEYNAKGSNARFIVTSLNDSAKNLYEKQYCARGEMENRIKEQFLLFSDRTSCHRWWPNQLRILLSGLAYILLERMRSLFLKGSKYASSQVNTIRLRILKIGAVIIKNTRKICFYLSSSFPDQSLFIKLANHFNTS
jgi:hypothetical protein